ncbi:YciI family protein [Erythrobacter dokdonensis]|uniref:YCII-like protein n=1 Tax=Erythrobacter dokdonensis DSW-74 TaxID=1300349 RepID=A0A1A7BIX0_9SPHN|nr:YciI family protein [Erythrobacter dokdonensis]OBV12419.1 YCII-like protein [Erythrobacter dokdonensis DSW-74]
MQFMLLINEDGSPYADPDGGHLLEQVVAGHIKLAEDLVAAGVPFSGERLKAAATATTVRSDNGVVTIHDGPFAETHEELGGFYIIDVASLDEALAWARRIPVPKGGVEVRPVWQMEG